MTEELGTPWIQLSDLSEIEIWIGVLNTTTQVPVPSSASVEICALSLRELILTMPKNSCSIGHLLSIQLKQREKPRLKAAPVKGDWELVSITAKVTGEEPLNRYTKSVIMTLYQCEEDEWNSFLKRVEQRQSTVNQIVSGIRE